MQRVILHVDMDEFFAAVEKLDNPRLIGKPLLVGGDPSGRGVVSTASYEARRFGCGSAMPMSQALRRCPHAIVLPVRGKRYAAISREIFAVFHHFTPAVEPLSIDEAFLDLTGSRKLLGPPEKVARKIKDRIRRRIGLTASVGVAPNKFLAKLASDLDKPDGLTVIRPDQVHQILDPLPVKKLWGVGPAAEKKLTRLGLHTIGQVRSVPARFLRDRLGELGEHISRLAAGQDERPVVRDSAAKSIGQETTFAQDIDDLQILRDVLLGQVQQVARRLRAQDRFARTVTLKLRTGDFATMTRSHTFQDAVDSTEELFRAAAELLEDWAGRALEPLRLLGVTAGNLQGRANRQLSLFASKTSRRNSRLDAAMDQIAEKFGPGAIRRGSSGGHES
ncbi:MAG: DNA polymerase IV [Phycisphaerae bacterium]